MVHALSLVQAAVPKAAYDLSTKPRPPPASVGKLHSSNLIEQKLGQKPTYGHGGELVCWKPEREVRSRYFLARPNDLTPSAVAKSLKPRDQSENRGI